MAAVAEIYARWAPPDERARFIVLSHSGVYFGTAINYPVSGFVAKLFGWEAIFYVSGERFLRILSKILVFNCQVSTFIMMFFRA